MKKAMFVYVLALLVALPQCAEATEYYVDMPPSGRPGFQKLCINYGGCESCTFLKTEDFEKFADQVVNEPKSNNAPTLRQTLVVDAMRKASKGCR